MQYSPKLKKAMEEIKAVLKAHDIAGFVVLHTPGFSEYLNHLTPSYSCAKVEPEGFRIRLKAEEVGKEKAKELANDTFNMFYHMAEIVGKHAIGFIDTEEMLRKKWDGYGLDEGGHTSHSQQNN